MNRVQKFETELEHLIERFLDIPYEDIADSLEYYAAHYRKLVEKEDEK